VATRAAGRALLRQPRWLAWLAPLAWALLIWNASAGSVDLDLPRGPWMGWLRNLGHAFLFGILTLLLLPLARRAGDWAVLGRGTLTLIGAVAIAYGIADELHQRYVEGRVSSPLDVLTDGVGVLAVLAVAAYAGRPEASEAGVRRRFTGGLVACLVAGAIATFGSG